MTFIELIVKILNEENKPLSSKEIWQIANEKPNLLKELDSKGQTPERTIYAILLRDLKSENPQFEKAGEYPLRVILKSQIQPDRDIRAEVQRQDADEQDRLDKSGKEENPQNLMEKDLYPLLSFFAFNTLNAYPKIINHYKSGKKKKGVNKWLHPDMVACHFVMNEWESRIAEFGKIANNFPVKLFSFELKRELTFVNLRESFFQALSNSSWAHEGYLVATNIDTDEEFEGWLARLSTSFGIGVIQLSLDKEIPSRILYPAKTKENLDWEMINILAGKNPTFEGFFETLNKILNGGIANIASQFEPILETKEHTKLINELSKKQ